jgi:hypothetical protein
MVDHEIIKSRMTRTGMKLLLYPHGLGVYSFQFSLKAMELRRTFGAALKTSILQRTIKNMKNKTFLS